MGYDMRFDRTWLAYVAGITTSSGLIMWRQDRYGAGWIVAGIGMIAYVIASWRQAQD